MATLDERIVATKIAARRNKKGKTPHQRIVDAGRRGAGVRLTAEEVQKLLMDDAIVTCAENDDEDEGIPRRSR